MPVNGAALAASGVGVILVWSGLHNASILTTIQDIVQGKQPKAGPKPTVGNITPGTYAAEISAATGDTGANNTTAAHNQAIAKVLAAPFGWSTGQEWEDLVSLWNRESGWSNTIENASSGAYGIAQALGHGPTNQYPAGPANPPTSSAAAQIAWGLGYILTTYGSPSAAWAHETAQGWY
jgi:hypothetical protein